MSVLDTAATIVKQFEGKKLISYKCPAGIWTCGYGATGYGVGQDTVWTEEEAEDRLRADLLRVQNQLLNSISIGTLTDNQQSALISFIFNVGIGAFDSSTMRKLILAGRMMDAADQFPRWNKGGGRVLPGLIARRSAERQLFLKPDDVEVV